MMMSNENVFMYLYKAMFPTESIPSEKRCFKGQFGMSQRINKFS